MAEIKDHFIGAIIFIIMVTGVISLITLVNNGEETGDRSDMVQGFADSNQLTEYNRSVNIIDNVTNNINELKTDIKSLQPKPDLSAVTLPIAFINTGWDAIKLIINGFDFMANAFGSLNSFLGLPSWLPGMIVLIFGVLLIFAVIGLIFGKDF